MKILLAAGIFYPDVGGPAIHVRKIAERLVEEKFDVTVIAYGDDKVNFQFPFKVKRISRKYPIILQWFFYSILCLKESLNSRVVYAFDPTAAGIPSCFIAKMLGKPFLIRVGGDPIWERVVENGQRFLSIDDYYKQGLYMEDKPTLYKWIKGMLIKSDIIVFYNQFWKTFYNKYFGIPNEKIKIIKNPVFKRENGNESLSDNPVILFAGRFVAYKNLPLVMKAFENVRNKYNKGELVLIGKGPDKESLEILRQTLKCKDHIIFKESVPQDVLFDLIKKSSICIGPALSEFNPNFILEALSFGKPVILSNGHGLTVDLPEEMTFDPFNQKELEEKIIYLLNSDNYKKAVQKVNHLDLNQSWENVTDFHLNLIKKCII